ncbi:MAG: DUF190 domain-containing protein [Arenicellales bacterium]|nr:DUF190 domain-containing protein [Arenicellales bacterium]
MVRVYLSEADRLLHPLLAKLHDEENVRGVTVFRGISGFGKNGRIHSSSLLDLASDLPVVIEFFDEPDKVKTIIKHLNTIVGPGHIVSWQAELNE